MASPVPHRPPVVQAQVIAGGGRPSAPFGGNGGPALSASLEVPRAIAVDSDGNVFVADNLEAARPPDVNCQIREIVAATGLIKAVAGTGTPGISGDGGPAVTARLAACGGIALDQSGNIFVSDATNGVVREVAASDGLIRRVAGGGKLTSDGIKATDAALYGPQGLAIDRVGNLFIADTGNNRICKVDSHGVITTIAGRAEGGLGGYDGDGGPATSARLNQPYGLGFDASGNLLIADTGNNAVRRVTPSGKITTVAGSGLAVNGALARGAFIDHPHAVAGDALGNYFIAAGSLQEVTASGVIFPLAARGQPFSMFADWVAVDPSGEVFVADTIHGVIWKVTVQN